MKTIGQFTFPETRPEADVWEPYQRVIALHSQVLCVAHTREEGAWNAYCFPVPGQNHDREASLWESEGSKLLEKIARAVFPDFDGVPYAH